MGTLRSLLYEFTGPDDYFLTQLSVHRLLLYLALAYQYWFIETAETTESVLDIFRLSFLGTPTRIISQKKHRQEGEIAERALPR